MHTKLFSFYEEFGATARAKNEALATRAAFVTGVMEQSYRLWLTLLTTEVTEAVRAAQELSTCKTPSDVAEVQQAWLTASSTRAITSLQGTVEIANFLIKNLQDTLGTASAMVPTLPNFTSPLAPHPVPALLEWTPPNLAPPPPAVLAEAVLAMVVPTEVVPAAEVPVTIAPPVVATAHPEPGQNKASARKGGHGRKNHVPSKL
ncbi:MAG: phasin family protein [Rhodospirillaceae bacterium]